jgi:hypothetical protein
MKLLLYASELQPRSGNDYSRHCAVQASGDRSWLLAITRVAAEKLAQREFAEIASRQEALQTIFPSLLDICITRFSTFLRKTEFFNSHRIYQ